MKKYCKNYSFEPFLDVNIVFYVFLVLVGQWHENSNSTISQGLNQKKKLVVWAAPPREAG